MHGGPEPGAPSPITACSWANPADLRTNAETTSKHGGSEGSSRGRQYRRWRNRFANSWTVSH